MCFERVVEITNGTYKRCTYSRWTERRQAQILGSMNVCQQFGANLRKERLKRGISQERLALEAGINRSYVGSVERGERNVSLVNICKLAKAIGCSSSELMTDVEVETP